MGKLKDASVSNISQLAAGRQGLSPTENGKVLPPRRRKDTRPRKHLLPSEVAALLKAARESGRYRLRDEAAVMLAYRHGLRATELVSLLWSQIHLKEATITIRRAKGGMTTEHPLRRVELQRLGRLRKESPDAAYVLMSERGTPWGTSNFRKVLQRLAKVAKLEIAVNPHALRHGCGFKLAADGVDTRGLSHYLGHRSLQSTERYTAQSAARFKDFWRD
jgi:type 1 fimbriae regulatory protein FimB/type 1 fimbriae regulatory protein FimE